MIKSCVIHATSEYARSRNGSVVSSGTRIVLMWAAFINFAVEGSPSELCEQSLRLKWIRPQWMEDLRACVKKDLYNQGPRRGRGWGGGAGRPHSLNKIKWNKIEKYTLSNKRNLWWNKNIRLADVAKASKFMIGPFRSYITKWLSLQNYT